MHIAYVCTYPLICGQDGYVVAQWVLIPFEVGLDRTGHMSFLTGQDRTPKFAGQVLPDRTESRIIVLNILHTKYRLSILIK